MTFGTWRQIPYVGGILDGWSIWTDVTESWFSYTHCPHGEWHSTEQHIYKIVAIENPLGGDGCFKAVCTGKTPVKQEYKREDRATTERKEKR